MLFKRCFLLGGFSLCCSNVAREVNVVLAVVRQLVIADVIATVTRDLSLEALHFQEVATLTSRRALL